MIKVVVRNCWRIYILIFQFLYHWKPWCWSVYFKNKDLSEWKAKEFRKIWFVIPGLHIWKKNIDIDFSKSACSTSRKKCTIIEIWKRWKFDVTRSSLNIYFHSNSGFSVDIFLSLTEIRHAQIISVLLIFMPVSKIGFIYLCIFPI